MESSLKNLGVLVETLTSPTETVSLILKAHLLTEHFIDQLLGQSLGDKKEKIYKFDLSYATKLSMIESLDLLPSEGILSLRKLNRLRNDCVHTLNAKPPIEKIREIIDVLKIPAHRSLDIGTTKELIECYMATMSGYLTLKDK